MREKKTCEECGKQFQSESSRQRFCKTCERSRELEARREYKKRLRLQKAKLKNGGEGTCRCKFCGSNTRTGREFCPSCVEQGFDDVFRFTRKSNGWDAEPRKHVEIVDGWRGQGIVGGNVSDPKVRI